jgi:quinol monooxygenase YgiN
MGRLLLTRRFSILRTVSMKSDGRDRSFSVRRPGHGKLSPMSQTETARTLHVVALFDARPGRREELRELLASLVAPTRRETGCLDYRLLEDRENPQRFIFVEEWTDEAALDRHLQTPHLTAARAAFPDLVVGDVDLRRCALVQ